MSGASFFSVGSVFVSGVIDGDEAKDLRLRHDGEGYLIMYGTGGDFVPAGDGGVTEGLVRHFRKDVRRGGRVRAGDMRPGKDDAAGEVIVRGDGIDPSGLDDLALHMILVPRGGVGGRAVRAREIFPGDARAPFRAVDAAGTLSHDAPPASFFSRNGLMEVVQQ